jgi:hypothetical protein
MADRQKSISSESIGPHIVKLVDWISCAPFEQLLNMKSFLHLQNQKSQVFRT